jgi:hypothetical protein
VRRRTLAIVLFVLLVPATSRAQTADANELFAQANALIAEERWSDAIPKLEEAQRIDPGIGIQFNLALCYAKAGRLAAAWRNLREVESLARAAGKKKREDAARAMLEELRGRVAFVSVRVVDGNDVTIRVDGETVPRNDLAFVVLERGDHTIEAVAFGRKPFTTRVSIERDAEQREVVVPRLEREAMPAPPPTPTADPANTRRLLGWFAGGIGLAGAAAAAVTGAMILTDKATAERRCTPDCITPSGEFDSRGANAVREGKTLLPINVAAWVVAALGIGGGTFLLLTSPAPKQTTKSPGLTLWF